MVPPVCPYHKGLKCRILLQERTRGQLRLFELIRFVDSEHGQNQASHELPNPTCLHEREFHCTRGIRSSSREYLGGQVEWEYYVYRCAMRESNRMIVSDPNCIQQHSEVRRYCPECPTYRPQWTDQSEILDPRSLKDVYATTTRRRESMKFKSIQTGRSCNHRVARVKGFSTNLTRRIILFQSFAD